MTRQFIGLLMFSFLLVFISCKDQTEENQNLSVKNVMDEVITRLYKEVPPENYTAIDDDYMIGFLSEQEKSVLATKYQYFKVNVPVTVSLMRDVNQATIPFWLEDSGFSKTDGVIKNDVYQYEVWQKDFEAGWVNLGINGFDMHRPVYFISVGAKNPGEVLKISDAYPEKYSKGIMEEGAFTYHDWSDLKITKILRLLLANTYFHIFNDVKKKL